MPLRGRTEFYDVPTVMARLDKRLGHFDYFQVLRVSGCHEPGTSIQYRTEREKMTMDAHPTARERKAMEYAGQMVGEYLDSLKSTDLANMTAQEYSTMIEVACSNFQNMLCIICREKRDINDDEIPY